MPKLYLKFNGAVIKEIDLKKDAVTFGRKPNNDIVIDNPAISGFHGKIFKDGEAFAVEDLNSTNGTFLNGQRVKHAFLKHRDQIGIARHVLEFSADNAPASGTTAAAPAQAASAPEASSEQNSQLDMLRQSLGIPPKSGTSHPAEPVQPLRSQPPPPPAPINDHPLISDPVPLTGSPGVIKIIAGSVNGQSEIKLKELVTYIGTSDQAAVKIKGLLAPSLAAAVSRRPEGYFLKAVKSGYPKVNGRPITEQVLLEHGALIEVGATNMVFYLPDSVKKPPKPEEPSVETPENN